MSFAAGRPRITRLTRLAGVACLTLTACSTTVSHVGGSGGSSGVSGSTGTTTSGTPGTSGSTGSTGTTSGSSSSGDFDAGGQIQTYTTGMGPIPLMPGEEETNCIVIPLGNAAGGYVRRFRADLSEGSHHMIVYVSSEAENSTPTPCQPLGGILSGDQPIFIAQQPEAELVYPTDETSGNPVGYKLAANQMVKIEFHTINTTSSPLQATGKAYIDTIPLGSSIVESNIAFWGTAQIDIPANGSFDTNVQFQAAIPGTKSFAVTTHQHHLGTEMKVWYSNDASDTTTMVADSTNWANPALVMPNPALDFPANASKGLAYECHWVNPTPNVVKWGESANDEMCFLWHYYYPSSGFQFCIDGQCQ